MEAVLSFGKSAASDVAVALADIAFSYPARAQGPTSLPLFEDFSLSVGTGSVLAVMGGSGCGKSTLGRMVAGLTTPKRGAVELSRQFTRPADVVYVDQIAINSVFPWQSVYQNLRYPLIRLGWDHDEATERVQHLASVFHIEHLHKAYPAQLSGGELQRLAIARSLGWRPQLAVLDESLSALDQVLRRSIIESIRNLVHRDDTTMVLITHNISDALVLADRCIVLGGRPVKIVIDFDLDTQTDSGVSLEMASERLAGIIQHGYI